VDLPHWLGRATHAIQDWADTFGVYETHPSLTVSDERFAAAFEEFTGRLKDNYPFFHPHYAGQMLMPPHPATVVGHLTAMLINPNNHALDGGPATAAMEREAVARLAAMFGYETHLGHLTASGTIANLEALFVARELHPGRGVAYSEDAHYTHSRMCRALGLEGHPRTHRQPRPHRPRCAGGPAAYRSGGDGGSHRRHHRTRGRRPVHEALELRERHGVRIHVDAAYGGFFTLLAGAEDPAGLPPAPWRAIARCDSIVVDPHKHGLQPYGCGAVLFRDPEVGRFYVHDSPCTYFTSTDLHLGEISLECSRGGASAAALWLTFQLLPPTRDGLGRVLAVGRRAALKWAELITASEALELYQQPELDILTYFPAVEPACLIGIDTASARVLTEGMNGSDPVFLSTFKASRGAFTARHPGLTVDAADARVLRSVLMKPESEHHVERLHGRVEEMARSR
jgi:glutamate/tyrosine decarboxylase-like PLP-dependent enzyme